MDQTIHRSMIDLSNNSVLTTRAAEAICKLDADDKRDVMQWLQHAQREQQSKISNAKRKF